MRNHPSYGIGLGRVPLRTAGLYALFGLLWIWLSDVALIWLGFDPNRAFLVGAIKGTVYVSITAALLHWLVRREVLVAEQSERLLRAVVEGTNDAVFAKDRQGRYLLANEAVARFIGRPVSEVVGHDDRELFEAADAERIIANDRAIMAERKVVSFEELITSRGVKRTYHATKAPLFDSNGDVAGVIGVSRDITERRATEDALRDSEQRYRRLADAIPQIVWTATSDGAITHVNSIAVNYSGLNLADLAGWSWERAIHPDDRSHALSEWSLAIGDGVPRTFEMRLRRADGEYRWHMARQCPIRNAAGVIESWVGTCTDIDDARQAENALRETETRLREAQRIALLGSWSWEPQTDRVSWSDAEFELFNVTQDEVNPGLEAFLSLLHPDDRQIALGRVESMKAGDSEFANDMRIIRPDGETIWIHSRARATRDADGHIVRVEGTDQDITARKQVVDALRESERRLRLTLDAAGAISFLWDIRNDAVSRFFSTEPSLPVTAERLGTLNDVRARIHADDLAGFDARLAASLAAGSEYRNQFRVVRPDGSSATLEEYGYVNRDADGVPHSLTGISIDISERISATEALRVSEERLRVALQGARGGVWDWDLSSGNVWWSPEVYELMGAPEGMDTREAQAVQLIYESDRQMVLTAIADALARRVDYHCEFRVHGGTRWLSSHARLFCNAAGDPIRLLGISWDISDRMIAMEALRESEERYRRLVAVLPTAVFVHNGNRVLYSNPAFNHLIGAESVNEVFERHPIDLVHPDDRPLMQAHAEERIATEEPLSGREIRFTRVDGRTVPTYCVSTPITGYGPHALLVAVTDLTERERAMQLLRSVLSSVGDAILTIDEHGVIGTANPAAVRQFGYIDDELIGLSVAALMQEPFVQEHEGYLFSYLKTGEPKVIGLGREVGCRRRDGSVFPAELTVTEFSLDGERRFTGVLRDITERKRLQTQFSQAQKMEAVGRLAGGIAHDFNNLLTIISGYCELLMMSDIPAGDKRRESIAAIRDAGERAARLTQQLLAFSRKAVIEPKLIDLNEMVSDSAKLLRRLIGEDIILVVITAPRPIPIKADPGQLEQVIMNLVVNARDAMPTGGRLTIETATILSSEGSGTEVARLSVSDTGQGMSDDVKEKIFEPFFTTKGVGKGTGLGLAVVHGVVTQSGGQVVIQSDVGVGTTFEILLPLVTDPPSTASVDSARYANRGTETVLLVEDDKAVRRITRISLQSQGYTVLEASNGVAGLQQAETYPSEIHLLISDVVMPEMGGRQLLDAVRKHRPELRVLFMSGYTDDAVLLHGVIEATDAFIQKPFTPLSLARKVREVIDAPRS